MKTRKQTYQTIARAYYCEPESRTEKQSYLSSRGLCYATSMMESSMSTPPFVMMAREYNVAILGINYYDAHGHYLPTREVHGNYREYHLTHTRQHDLIRADFCVLMSLLTNKEYKEISQ